MPYNAGALNGLTGADVAEILDGWDRFINLVNALAGGSGDLSVARQLAPVVALLCGRGLALAVRDHFLLSLEEMFRRVTVKKFWRQFDAYSNASPVEKIGIFAQEKWPEEPLSQALEDICLEKGFQEKCVLVVRDALQTYEDRSPKGHVTQCGSSSLMSRFHLMVASNLLATLPAAFPEILQLYFEKKLEELSIMMEEAYDDEPPAESGNGSTDCKIDHSRTPKVSYERDNLVRRIGKVVSDLRSLGFTSMTEHAYSSAIVRLLKSKVRELAGDDYRIPVLGSIKKWIHDVPLKFLHALLTYLGDSIDYESGSSGFKSPLSSKSHSFAGIAAPSEALIRWHLRLEYLAYETLQDIRIGKLFEIIVDYPDSSPSIEDLKRCLEYTGQHSKLVDSFISSMKYRLLTAGASTTDILHQYVSTIKALQTIDPAGVFLESVAEPVRDYLKGRKDTIKCIVTMFTEGTSANATGTGNTGDNLLEEISRDAENQGTADFDGDVNVDEKQAWLNAERWEPEIIEADHSRGSRHRRKVNILELMVNLIGSKDQLVNEYRVMLAEKLINKCDYDIDSEIRTLELLKIHFGESCMQKCEVMINDMIASKRLNTNIKTSLAKGLPLGSGQAEPVISLDILDATIISANFWPPIQTEELFVPPQLNEMLTSYAYRFHEIKTPRKLMWRKNLGAVKLELKFEDQTMQFTVAPVYAVIIMQFHEKTSWTSMQLAEQTGNPLHLLNKRMSFWVGKGILTESDGPGADDHVFTIVESMSDSSKNNIAHESRQGFQMEEETENSIKSSEDQLKEEMTVFEKFIIGMLTNFGSMTLDKMHNTLKMFCVGEPSYDKSLQQLQAFMAGLASEDKIEMRDSLYFLKK